MFGRGMVNVVARRQSAIGEIAFVPALTDDPGSWGSLAGALRHQRGHLLWRCALVQPDRGELGAGFHHVDVAVEQAGDHRAAAE
jgi:hypothetical protein